MQWLQKLGPVVAAGFFSSAALFGQEHFCPAGPPPVACWAVPSDTGTYLGDYVGGGCAFGGHPRQPGHGTWGWDYRNCLLPYHTFLRWCGCYQGGAGAYKTDGPKFPPH